MDSQIGCDNVAKQRCCITKLQPTYNLKIKIALNLINVRGFKYQLNFFTLDVFKGYYGPLIFIFQSSLYFATTSFFLLQLSSKFPSSFGDGTVEGCTTQLPTEGMVPVLFSGLAPKHNTRPLARPVYISFMT